VKTLTHYSSGDICFPHKYHFIYFCPHSSLSFRTTWAHYEELHFRCANLRQFCLATQMYEVEHDCQAVNLCPPKLHQNKVDVIDVRPFSYHHQVITWQHIYAEDLFFYISSQLDFTKALSLSPQLTLFILTIIQFSK
jgi:hypothetical protein